MMGGANVAKYTDLILQNIAFKTTRNIGVYDSAGKCIGEISLGPLSFSEKGEKLYSFLGLADLHLDKTDWNTAHTDFPNALKYANAMEAAFVCLAGDVTNNGLEEELRIFKECVERYSPDVPVYAITGNHDANNYNEIVRLFKEYTGCPLYYSFPHRNDVFIMLGCRGSWEGGLFTVEELQWLYETLEANRNKRCFVFHHVRPQDGCGNAFGIYKYDIWGGTEATVFESLMHHYKNAHQFHGHSHLKFYLQYGSDVANIDHLFGGWSVHIPSLSVPRDRDPSGASERLEVYADSEGYVVDVYENGIHLKGRDFIKGEFLPVASYWLDTTLQMVEPKSYKDPTGTIIT